MSTGIDILKTGPGPLFFLALWTLLVEIAGGRELRLSETAELGGKKPGPGPGLSFTYWLVAVGR